MLLASGGEQIHTLGGALLVEDEVRASSRERAWSAVTGPSCTASSSDHDYAWADGLICGGKMVILAEAYAVPGPWPTIAPIATCSSRARASRRPWRWTRPRCGAAAVGARFLFDAEGRRVARLAGGRSARGRAGAGRAAGRTAPGGDPGRRGPAADPAPRPLVIVGGGHVGQAVAGLAAQVDFDVWVVDDRRQYASAERFPAAGGSSSGRSTRSCRSWRSRRRPSP